ncbi:helix-turn-helix domain-containing protein [Chloroflexota bacterium]
MYVSLVIRHRLDKLGLQQRDLATAAQVTESYISQLLTGKKAPPAANRTDIYGKMERYYRLGNISPGTITPYTWYLIEFDFC